MPISIVIKDDLDAARALSLVQNHKRPCTLVIADGIKRTKKQNDLSFKWYQEADQQLGQESGTSRAYCKLHFGVGIVKAADPDFAKKYDRVIRPLPYEAKLELMLPPLELPVTSLMKKAQKIEYLNMVDRHLTSLGVILTIPESEN